MKPLSEYRKIATQVIDIEINSLKKMLEGLDGNFDAAISLIQQCQGRVIVIGMGKSGIIGKKIAATFASTGTSSFFVHPGEAFHGDLGMIRPGDIALLISYSGETEELIRLFPFFQWQKNKTIALTGKLTSTLAKYSDVVLNVAIDREACNNNLAPTSSTTATLVMGDALAVTLSTLKNFQPADFARFHPGGNLGKRLLTKVQDVMQTKLPTCDQGSKFIDIVKTITNGRLGLALVMDGSTLSGIITDGDLRRALEKHKLPMELLAHQFMTRSPKKTSKDEMLSVAEGIMREMKISSLIVTDENNLPVGILQVFDGL
ncbi:MAG TPA: KpsF/GutQ family sugar-phosphate isomerase [Bacteriovoracaceae bacterium]|nr:KpsF/GutQ family sugar-phosphate isomerase [Bacteriovoracaceae bacterium]